MLKVDFFTLIIDKIDVKSLTRVNFDIFFKKENKK